MKNLIVTNIRYTSWPESGQHKESLQHTVLVVGLDDNSNDKDVADVLTKHFEVDCEKWVGFVVYDATQGEWFGMKFYMDNRREPYTPRQIIFANS